MEANANRTRITWALAPPLTYLVLSVLLLHFGSERFFFGISYPGFFFTFLLNIGGHGGAELAIIPNLFLHLLLGVAASFMMTSERRWELYLAGLVLTGGAAISADSMSRRLAAQHNDYLAQERSWRERIPHQRSLLASEDFDRGVAFWNSFCKREFEMAEKRSYPPQCPVIPLIDFQNAARMAGSHQEEIRCLSNLYAAVLLAVSPQGSEAQAAYARWKGCEEMERSERVVELERIYSAYIDNSLQREKIERHKAAHVLRRMDE